jgi:hypothetical protein
MCCNFSSKLGAHIFDHWLHANTTKVKAIRIPTSANCRIVAQLTVRMPFACVSQEIEMFVAEVEQCASETRGIGCSKPAVLLIPSIMLSTRIVEHCEQPNYLLDCSAPCCNKQTVAFNPTPVRWSMYRVTVTLKLPRDMLPNAFPIVAHCDGHGLAAQRTAGRGAEVLQLKAAGSRKWFVGINLITQSRRAEAIETFGKICPLRIVEIGRAVSANESVERVG